MLNNSGDSEDNAEGSQRTSKLFFKKICWNLNLKDAFNSLMLTSHKTCHVVWKLSESYFRATGKIVFHFLRLVPPFVLKYYNWFHLHYPIHLIISLKLDSEACNPQFYLNFFFAPGSRMLYVMGQLLLKPANVIDFLFNIIELCLLIGLKEWIFLSFQSIIPIYANDEDY